MKTLLKFILIFFVISLICNMFMFDHVHISYTGDSSLIESLLLSPILMIVSLLVMIVICYVLVVVFGAVIFSIGAVILGMIILGFSFTWPFLLGALFVYWLFSDRKQTHC